MRSDRLIFANARTRTSQLVDRDRLGVRRYPDAKDLGAERRVGFHLREREPDVEAPRRQAREADRSRQAALEITVLGPPAPARRGRMDDGHEPPRGRLAVAPQI